MTGRRGASFLLVLVAVLAACTLGDDPRGPDAPGERPDATGEQSPADTGPALADAAFWVGPPEIVMGPSRYVDSLFNGIKVGDTVRGYVGNTHTMLLEGSSVADVEPTGDLAIEAGSEPTLWDDCGAWLKAVERDQENPRLLRGWYHAEWKCDYPNKETDKSVAYAESRDGGRTFTKPGYPDNQVLSSPTGSVEGHHTGRGEPSIVRRGGYYYLYYRNVLPDLRTVTSVARAPVSSGGVPGSWHSYTVDEYGRARWTQDARGGRAAALETALTASSASLHLPSGEVVLTRQHPASGGIVLQASTDGVHFTALPEPIVPFLPSQIRVDWSEVDDGQIFGYTSIVAENGSRYWSDEFYLFHLYVFPGDTLHGERYLVRRRVSVTDVEEDDAPRSMVALTRYVGDGDRFDTSAPVKRLYDARPAAGYLLGTPQPGRQALFECTAANGDRFLAASCGESGERGRLAGYAFLSEQPGTVPLHRCAERADGYASVDGECEGGRELSVLGYVFPAP
ncbi:hypothetical protein [Nocardioides antri]|uniref:Exo-alpha-sialidase n=1 Tax=Nocardioides antri TaxID=2607659 RepID=A0A5B1M3Y8_9ACTN|nr:hypothetical protein [Nocardioides antri]KAA1427642.1 hypothetical protein F0U47_09360 [Nocardioides antri]